MLPVGNTETSDFVQNACVQSRPALKYFKKVKYLLQNANNNHIMQILLK